MRLFEAIMDANHRAVEGDASAGLHPADYAAELPLAALTCMDPRLNGLLPQALGVTPEDFVWIRNAGNEVQGAFCGAARSLALACVLRDAKEIVVIGHTDCLMTKTTTLQLLGRFAALGIERHLLPENINECFGSFASERTNVIKAVDTLRQSPLIGPKIPVHGLVINIETGRLEWLVNGYEQLGKVGAAPQEQGGAAHPAVGVFNKPLDFNVGEMKFPEGRIGEVAAKTEAWIKEEIKKVESAPAPKAPEPARTPPPRIPLPPVVRPRMNLRKPR